MTLIDRFEMDSQKNGYEEEDYESTGDKHFVAPQGITLCLICPAQTARQVTQASHHPFP